MLAHETDNTFTFYFISAQCTVRDVFFFFGKNNLSLQSWASSFVFSVVLYLSFTIILARVVGCCWVCGVQLALKAGVTICM